MKKYKVLVGNEGDRWSAVNWYGTASCENIAIGLAVDWFNKTIKSKSSREDDKNTEWFEVMELPAI